MNSKKKIIAELDALDRQLHEQRRQAQTHQDYLAAWSKDHAGLLILTTITALTFMSRNKRARHALSVIVECVKTFGRVQLTHFVFQ